MGKIIKNSITGQEFLRPAPIDKEVVFEGGVMITETDISGIIVYANKKFRDMTGYTREELIGSPHNINRHPDMPKEVFRELWETIKGGNYWEGCVKNLRKDGKYYVATVYIKAKLDDSGSIVGFIAGRKVPDEALRKRALELYKSMT